MKSEPAMKDLIRLDASRLTEVSQVLGRAFQDDPTFTYYMPDEAKRHKIAPEIFAIPLRSAFAVGEVYATSPNLEGIAVWVHSERQHKIEQIRSINSLRIIWSLGFRTLARMASVGSMTKGAHRRSAPFQHCYLFALGVDPHFQGQGFASRLIKPMLARLVKENLPCYLETQTAQNVAMYEHFGFKVMEKVDIKDTGLSFWAMLK